MINRLDSLQTELNRQAEESLFILNENDGLKEGMIKKANENKELLGRVFGLEKKTLDLELELSALRSVQQTELKENKENRNRRKSYDAPTSTSNKLKSIF